MASERVLIIEDDAALLRGLKDNFEAQGYHVQLAADGQQGLDAALANQSDLIVLDIMLPRVNGYEICRQIRQAGLDVPIIMLTAKEQESDIILGLNIGADDYITKPFSIKELLARANAFLRRRRQGAQTTHRFGEFVLDLGSHRLLRGNEEITLTPKEFSTLAYLVRRQGRALTRDDILDAVWGHDIFVTARSVDRCITTLRSKIERNPRQPVYIQTVRDIGYRFESGADDDSAC
jgi:DNA-binding response OmpR family regulator